MKRSAIPHFEFRAKESVRNGVLRFARLLASPLKPKGPEDVRQLSERVHNTRLVLKRARALVRLLGTGSKESKLRKVDQRLRQAAQRLALARDHAVSLATLTGLMEASPQQERGSLRGLHDGLAARQRTAAVAPKALTGHLNSAMRELSHAAKVLTGLPAHDFGWKAIEAGLHASYRRSRRRLKAAAHRNEGELFHSSRTCVKRLLYQLEMLKPAAPKRIGRLAADLYQIQKLLGDDHDLLILRTTLKRSRVPGKSSKTVKRLLDTMARRQEKLRARATKTARRAFKSRPGSFTAALHRDWQQWRKAKGPARPDSGKKSK